MQTQKCPVARRGNLLVLKGFVCVESFLVHAGLAVKRWWLRRRITRASELGLFHCQESKAYSLEVDRLTIALEEVGK